MIKTLVSLIITSFFSFIQLHAQNDSKIEVFIDSTSIMIGEKIDYYLRIKSNALVDVKLSEKVSFFPFEILEEYPIDTIENESGYIFTKKYSLIQFDSGEYFLPRQKVFVNGFLKFADSVSINVNNVKVDTLEQPLFDIKPIVEVKKNYSDLIRWILSIFFFSIISIGGIYLLFFKNKIVDQHLDEEPPFDRAIKELKELESFVPKNDQDYKSYYSSLTEIVRRYLEEDAKVTALESTSDQLLLKLELLKTKGKLDLKTQTLNNLKDVLRTADLVKFARSIPDKNLLFRDRSFAEEVVIETKQVLPEPSEEELREQEEYKLFLIKQRRKKRLYIGILSFVVLTVFSFFLAIGIYGFYPVTDTIFGNPTMKLKNAVWITSQYGNPPVKISTPEVLRRIKGDDEQSQRFVFGNYDFPFYIDLIFKVKTTDQKNEERKFSEENFPGDKRELAIQELTQLMIDDFKERGASNIFTKNEETRTFSGIPALKFFGTLDYPKDDQQTTGRFNYNTYIFDFESSSIVLAIVFPKDDRYAEEIEKRIVDSIEWIKEL